MSILRQKIDDELDLLDTKAMALLYEQLRQLNRASSNRKQAGQSIPGIEEVLQHTAMFTGNWSQDIVREREER